jgi:protein TonB
MSIQSERIRAALLRSEGPRRPGDPQAIEPVAVNTENLEALLGLETAPVERPVAESPAAEPPADVETTLPLLVTPPEVTRALEPAATAETVLPLLTATAEKKSSRVPVTALAVAAVIVVAGVSTFWMRGHPPPASQPAPAAPVTSLPVSVAVEPQSNAPTAATPPIPTPAPAAPAPIPAARPPAAIQPVPAPVETPQPNRPAARSFILPEPSQRNPEPLRGVLPDAPPPVANAPVPAAVAGLAATNRLPSTPTAPAPPAPAPVPAPTAPAPPRQIRVGGILQAANLIKKVTPVYPPLARETRVQGTVRFTAIIAKDGTIQNLHVLSGPALLVAPATDAVRKWVYRPTLLNGEPVEVVTQIDVAFSLGP